MKNGIVVFTKTYTKPSDPDCNWIILAIFILVAASVVLANMDYEKTVVQDGAGKTVSTTTKKSLGGGGVVDPVKAPVSSDPESDGVSYDIDHLYISSELCYPDGLPTEVDGEIEEVAITANGTPDITITNFTLTV